MLDLSTIDCVGCTSCASICPKGIIAMKRDIEGFPFPVIEEKNKCVNCGLCEKVCPVINNRKEEKRIDIGLIAQNTDESIRRESASGGMFSAIATSVLRRKGVVFGAAYSRSFEVVHIEVDNENELWRLRNSKYVQSNLSGIFHRIKELLDKKVEVCFSGTPCQIEGLKCFLMKDYENLLLVDVVCHGVSSPLIWEKYLETKCDLTISNVFFRWKHYGYKYSTMSFFDRNNSEVYYAGVESDGMLRAYFSNSCDRRSCYNCVFKKRYRVSDFTIWDCFHPRLFDKSFDDDKGTSCVLINSEKALKQFEIIVKQNLIRYCFVSSEKLTSANKEMTHSVNESSIRDAFLSDASTMPGEELFAKYYKSSFVVFFKRTVRLCLIRTKLYAFIKNMVFLIRRGMSE